MDQVGHLSGKAFKLAEPKKPNGQVSKSRHPSAPLRPSTRQVSIQSDKSRAGSAVSAHSKASSGSRESENNYRLSMKDVQSRSATSQSLCNQPGTMVRYGGGMSTLDETVEAMSVTGSGTPVERHGGTRRASERVKKSKSAKVMRSGSYNQGQNGFKSDEQFKFIVVENKGRNSSGNKGYAHKDNVGSVLKGSSAKSRATSVPSWFYGSKLKTQKQAGLNGEEKEFPNHKSNNVKQSDKLSKVNRSNTWVEGSRDMKRDQPAVNGFIKIDGDMQAIDVQPVVKQVVVGDNKSNLMQVKDASKSSASMINLQFMEKETQGGNTLGTVNQENKDDHLDGNLSLQIKKWQSTGNIAFTKREVEALKENVVDSLISPRLAQMKPGILRSLPLESELDKYLYYLHADKKRSSKFTKAQNRYVPGVKFRPGGAINRPYVSPSPLVPPTYSKSGVPTVVFDSLSEGAAGDYQGEVLSMRGSKGSRANSGKTSVKTQLRESVLRQSQLSVSGSTSGATESASS